jgi:hypothetical protein
LFLKFDCAKNLLGRLAVLFGCPLSKNELQHDNKDIIRFGEKDWSIAKPSLAHKVLNMQP